MGSRIIPVIMSGGSGSRLWPLSTDERPKQFHAVTSDASLIQATVQRFIGGKDVEFLPPVVVCNARHLDLVQDQFAGIGVVPSAIVLEPAARNTAAVAVVAALVARAVDPDALVLLTPADHTMDRPEALVAAISSAQEVARSHIVTFGINARTPATGYGYIKRAEALADGVFRIDRFLEKPSLEQAVAYVADGGYDWNAGLFLYAPALMLAEADRHAPQVRAAVQEAFNAAQQDGTVIRLDADAFARSPSISVDNAIMELTDRGAVAPCDPVWSDIGSWSELWSHLPQDAAGNALVNGAAIDGSNNLVWAPDGRPVVVVGMSDVIVVSTEAGVVVVPKARDQDVRLVHEALRGLGKEP